MERITVAQIQKLVDQCSGYNISFIQCLTKEINLLIASSSCGANCKCNEEPIPVPILAGGNCWDCMEGGYFYCHCNDVPVLKPTPKHKTTIITGSTAEDDCKT